MAKRSAVRDGDSILGAASRTDKSVGYYLSPSGLDSSRGGQHAAVTLVVISSLVSVGREIAVAAEIGRSRNGELKVAAEERHNRYMPIQLTQRSRAVLWLLVRLVVFAAVTYVAVESLLLKPSREKLFDGV